MKGTSYVNLALCGMMFRAYGRSTAPVTNVSEDALAATNTLQAT